MANMIPSCMVEDGLKLAREIARESAADIEARAKCVAVTVVASSNDEFPGRMNTSMAVSPGLEDVPETEVALMKCAASRILSLLVLHLGYREAMACAIHSCEQGAELARIAEEGAD